MVNTQLLRMLWTSVVLIEVEVAAKWSAGGHLCAWEVLGVVMAGSLGWFIERSIRETDGLSLYGQSKAVEWLVVSLLGFGLVGGYVHEALGL